MGRLLEAIYGEDLPSTARAQAQISISSLRRTFGSYCSKPVIITHELGYVLQAEDERLDRERVEQLVTAARAARETNSVDLAVARYRDALRLWRGPALDGIESALLRAAAHRLDEQRIATNEERLALELDLGRHHELVGELGELVEEHPVRERLRGQLMLALYRSGRAGDALNVYRRARHTMLDELGIEPSEHLQQLEHAIRTCDPSLEPRSRSVVVAAAGCLAPNLLPTNIADFTGRTEQIEQIRLHLTGEGERERGRATTAPVVVITGKGGVGKTSLVTRMSHEIASHFPDGQLFANLHGGASHPVSPAHVLERFLRAFGVPSSQIPDGLDERAEIYRNLLADQKVLVVLDDAVTESQVSPLIPGGGAAAVMITSRSRLAGLAGAEHVELDVFDTCKSLELLSRIVGAQRVQAEPCAAAEVARHCGHLPLALRIAGARLGARPHWRLQQLADRLGDETRRLDELTHGDMGIRPSISFVYESASERARRLFRRLGLLDLPLFSSWLGCVLINEPLADVEDLLADLVSAQLIETTGEESGVHSKYRFHDLIRVFARECLAAEETAAERRAVLERALSALLYLADEAHCRYNGGDSFRIKSNVSRWALPEPLTNQLAADPLAWYERERATLVAGVQQAAQAGFTELCWNLASGAEALFESRMYVDDWQETHEIALEAARKAHDRRGQAAMLYSLGSLHVMQQRFYPAYRELKAAARLFQDLGDDLGVAHVIRYIAYLDRMSGRLDEAADHYEQATAIFSGMGDDAAVACLLHNRAWIQLELERFDEAMELLSESLRLCQAAAQGTKVEAQVLHGLGEARLKTGDPARAVIEFERALAITRDIGDLIGQAYALRGIGVAKVRLNELDRAREVLRRALELASCANDRVAEARVLLGLSELAAATGDHAEAILFGQRAATAFREVHAPLLEAQALRLLSDAHAALGDGDASDAAAAEAATLRTKALGCSQAS